MVNVGKNLIASERVNMSAFMLALHGSAFCLALTWLLFLHFNLSWKNLLPMRKLQSIESGT